MTTSQLTLLPTPTSSAGSVVYYATDLCHVKIGRTSSPSRRGGELKVDMLLTFDGGELDERRHQRMWQRFRIDRTEWFYAEAELLLWLDVKIPRDTYESAVLQRLIYRALSRSSQAAA